jgi:acyl dehydratase
MLVIKNPADFQNYVGKTLGTSEWRTVDQKTIDQYADLSGDHQWIHVDVERAKRESPGGKTIAHGYLVLTLISTMAPKIWTVEKRSRALNYGLNKLRFTGVVPVDSRIRLRHGVKSVEPMEGGFRIVFDVVVEVEGAAKPALVAEQVIAYFN